MGKIFNTPLDMWETHKLMSDIKNSHIHKALEYQKKFNNPYKYANMGYKPQQPYYTLGQKIVRKLTPNSPLAKKPASKVVAGGPIKFYKPKPIRKETVFTRMGDRVKEKIDDIKEGLADFFFGEMQ